MNASTEKRRFPRAIGKWPVIIQTSNGIISTEVHNMSIAGAFIRLWKPLEVDEDFRMFISTPNLGRALSLDAQVIWVNKGTADPNITQIGMGVTFVQISTRDRNLISSIISKHTPHSDAL